MGSGSWGKPIRGKGLSFSKSIEPVTEHSNVRENEDEEGEEGEGEEEAAADEQGVWKEGVMV